MVCGANVDTLKHTEFELDIIERKLTFDNVVVPDLVDLFTIYIIQVYLYKFRITNI